MATSNKILNEKLREKFLGAVSEFFGKEEEVLRVGSNEIAIPCLDEEGNEKFITIVVKVPTGSRDGDAYDGYALAEDYAFNLAEKKKKAEARAEEKARKIAKDKKKREEK